MKGLLFTYLMTYGGAAVSLFDPFVGLLIYIGFSVLRPESLWHWSVPAGNYSRIVAIALLIGWALKGFGRWEFGNARAIVMALVGFTLWAGAAALIVAEDQTVALKFMEEFSKIVLPFLVGITLIDSMARIKLLAWVILLSHGYIALEFNLAYLGGYNALKENGFGGMDNNCVAVELVACVGLAFFLGVHSEKWWQKALALGSAALLAHSILLSFSRGGMLAFLMTGLVIFLLIPKQPKHYLLFLLCVAGALRFAGPEVRERFLLTFEGAESRDESANMRLRQWRYCMDSISKNPVIGVGPDQWPIVVTRYGKSGEAHNLWLTIAAELGLIGLALLMSFYGLCVARLWQYTRESATLPDPWIRPLARMVISALIGFTVAATFVSLKGLEIPYYIVLLGASVLKVSSTQASLGDGHQVWTGDEHAVAYQYADEGVELAPLSTARNDINP